MECYNESYFKTIKVGGVFHRVTEFKVITCGINYKYVEMALTFDESNRSLKLALKRTRREKRLRGSDVFGENHCCHNSLYFIANLRKKTIKVMYEGDK